MLILTVRWVQIKGGEGLPEIKKGMIGKRERGGKSKEGKGEMGSFV